MFLDEAFEGFGGRSDPTRTVSVAGSNSVWASFIESWVNREITVQAIGLLRTV